MKKADELSYEMGALRYNIFNSRDQGQIDSFSTILDILENQDTIDGQIFMRGYTDELIKRGGLLKANS